MTNHNHHHDHHLEALDVQHAATTSGRTVQAIHATGVLADGMMSNQSTMNAWGARKTDNAKTLITRSNLENADLLRGLTLQHHNEQENILETHATDHPTADTSGVDVDQFDEVTDRQDSGK